MARLARIVVPGIAHLVTQRGNRRQPVFFAEEDYAAYVDLVTTAARDRGVRCLAWCLMPNHVHLIWCQRMQTVCVRHWRTRIAAIYDGST